MARRQLPYLLALALLLCTVPVNAQDWTGKGRAQGLVKDDNGQPLAGVLIRMRQPGVPEDGAGPENTETDTKGRWVIGGLKGGVWNVLIDAEGFLPSQGTVRVNEFSSAKPITVELTRNPYAFINVAEELLAAGKYSEARVEYERAIPNMDATGAARLRSRVGDTYLEEGDYAAARGQYELALPLIPTDEQAAVRIQLASSYQREGNLDKAMAAYEETLPLLGPEGVSQVLLAMARAYDQAERRGEAVKLLERALAATPDNPPILQVLADLLSREGREEEAKQYLARLPEGTKLPADMLLNMGIRHYNQGEMDEALSLFDRAVRDNPSLAEVYYYRGLVHLGRGANDLAAADLHQLLELEPGSSHAEEAREFLTYLDSGS